MKAFISHPNVNRIRYNDEQPLNIEAIDQIPDACCIRLNLNNILDFVLPKNRDRILLTALKKIRIDGEILINGIDFFAVAIYINNGLLTVEDFNKSMLNGRLSMDAVNLIQNKLIDAGFEINRAYIEDFSFDISAKRKP